MKTIKFKILEGGKLPQYKTEGAACCDCYARLNGSYVELDPGNYTVLPLGFMMELPDGYEAVIRPRSGLSKKRVDVQVGTIDSDYRGEVGACLVNNSKDPYVICDGDRICQMKIQKAEKFRFEICNELSNTKRGKGGFGSTGIQ